MDNFVILAKTIELHVIVQECGQTWTRVRVRTSIYCSDNY